MKLFFSLLIAFYTLSAQTFSKENWAKNYEQALTLAEKEHKDILLIVGLPGCKWCGRLIHFTVTSDTIEAYTNKHLIILYTMYGDKSLPKNLNTKIFPTSYIISKNGKRLRQLQGYQLADDYILFLKQGIHKNVPTN